MIHVQKITGKLVCIEFVEKFVVDFDKLQELYLVEICDACGEMQDIKLAFSDHLR